MSEQEVDMSKVKVGTRVRYRNGYMACVNDINCGETFPFLTGSGIFHKPNGKCCIETLPCYDIVSIIEDAQAESANESDERPTLRDKFAMAALTGFLSRGVNYEVVSLLSYNVADKMMEARSK